MICGLPPALSATDSVPVRAPEAVGVKVTLIVQFPPAAKVAGLVGQALAPVLVVRSEERGAGKESSTAAGPEFDSVTVIGALVAASNCLPRSRQMRSESESRAVPCPLSLMICGLPPALSATDSVPVRAPKDAGVKVTLIVQFPLAAKVAGLMGQALAPVLVVAKSPEAANELIVKAAAPVFVSVTVIGALVVASNWLPKARLVGANPTPGAEFEPVPPRLTFCGLFTSSPVITSVTASAAATDGVKVTLTLH